jgi:hypothetical protein
MARAAKKGGPVAAYVWDYGVGCTMRHFWNAAAALDQGQPTLMRTPLPLCNPDPLAELFQRRVGRRGVHPLDIWTVFADFDDYWLPFLGGGGRRRLRDVAYKGAGRTPRAFASLPFALDGSIPLTARAGRCAVLPRRLSESTSSSRSHGIIPAIRTRLI